MFTPYTTRRCTFALTVAAAALLTSNAYAFQISETQMGAMVHWDDAEVVYYIHDAEPAQMAFDTSEASILKSFEAWNGHGAKLNLSYGGKTTHKRHGYVRGDENKNIVIWEDDAWEYDPNALALTLTSFERSTGRLVDADIIINGADYDWSTTDAKDKHDLCNSLTHEVGHFIGLAHSDSEHATMYASASAGELLKRTLYNDDIRALTFLYDTNGSAIGAGSDWEDGSVYQDEDSGYRVNDAQVHVACSTTAPSGSPSSNGFVAGLVLFLLGLGVWARKAATREGIARAFAAVFVASIAVGAVMTVSAEQAQATTLPLLSLEQVTVSSDRVVVAEIIAQTADFEGGVIWTHTTARVEECWSGECVDETVVIRTPGGAVGDIEQQIHGLTPMHLGDRLVLFLQASPHTLGQVFRPVGMALGALPIRRLGDADVAVRDLGDVSLVTRDRVTVHGEDETFAMNIKELRGLVRGVR